MLVILSLSLKSELSIHPCTMRKAAVNSSLRPFCQFICIAASQSPPVCPANGTCRLLQSAHFAGPAFARRARTCPRRTRRSAAPRGQLSSAVPSVQYPIPPPAQQRGAAGHTQTSRARLLAASGGGVEGGSYPHVSDTVQQCRPRLWRNNVATCRAVRPVHSSLRHRRTEADRRARARTPPPPQSRGAGEGREKRATGKGARAGVVRASLMHRDQK